MKPAEILSVLRVLEKDLHQSQTRLNRERLDQLLHSDFIEYGRSGKSYNKPEIVEALLGEQGEELKVWSQDYALQYCENNAAMLLYKSAHIQPDGTLDQFSLRSSLWVKENNQWQMLFHQGTATGPFSRTA